MRFIDLLGLTDTDPILLPEVEVKAERSNAAPAWKEFISQFTNEDFQAFRKGPATDYIRDSRAQHIYHPGAGMESEGVEEIIEDTQSVATEDEALGLLKEAWSQENSVHGMNYLSLRAETVSTTAESIPVLSKTAASLVLSWVGAKITANATMAKAWGPRQNWIRVDKSFSQSGQFQTYAIKWGASPAKKGKYINQIGSEYLKKVNESLRNFKFPGDNWRMIDPGHFHLKKY